MTRKRYTKLMMSTGMDRNAANRSAKLISTFGRSYLEDYIEYKEVIDSILSALNSI